MEKTLKIQSMSDIVTNSSDETYMIDDYMWETFNGSHGAEIIAEERKRQMDIEGFSLTRDDHYNSPVEFLEAAIAYIQAAIDGCHDKEVGDKAKQSWPWNNSWFKPTKPKRDLEKAGALVAAAIDYIERNGYTREEQEV